MNLSNFALFSGAARGSDAIWSSLAAKYGVGRQIHIRPVGTRDIENYNIKDKLTGEWVPRAEFVGHDKANRLIAMMEQVFIQAVNN